jgi:putative redox protein
MEAKVTWHHGMSFTGSADSGFTVNLGSSAEVGGDDDGFRPMELVLVGLVGCTGMDVISILRKMRQEVTGFGVTAVAEKAETHPKVFTKVLLRYEVHGRGIDPSAVEKAIKLSAERYCPVQAMLAPTVQIETVYEIVEA